MRTYPLKCRNCGKDAVVPTKTDYSTEREHDGRTYPLTVPNLEVLECRECHTQLLSAESRDKVTDALRAAVGLLTPKEIREHRKRLGLTQDQLATSLKVAKATVSRWETGGQIQQRAMDLLLRVFFEVQAVRDYLASPPSVSTTTSVTTDNAAYGGTVWIRGYHLELAKQITAHGDDIDDPVKKRIIEQIVSWKSPSTAIVSR